MTIPAWGLIPFVLMLLSIAIFPLVPALAGFWDKPRNQLIVALILGVPVALWMILGGEPAAVVGALIEYFNFIMLLLCLFTVAGGIYLRGDVEATPRNNTIFLAIGGGIASFIGTTGAAMLLIRPILNTNEERKHVAHTVIYTIFIVANAGGLLTPLGDPPLFLGMLRGVPFTWTFNLFKEWAFVLIILLVSYYCLDRKLHAMESKEDTERDRTETEPIHLDGKMNFLFFAIIIVAVALAPSMNAEAIEAGTATLTDWIPTREIIMGLAALASLKFGSDKVRYDLNKFVWAPILEVASVFVGIFLTMIPALRYLAEVAPKLHLNEASFYFLTGSLSSFLDNAPTYATFFSIAGELPGDPRVAGVPEHYLVAISLGAVFFGAMTYIGNGPNFMVKSVAESAGTQMPSFGGYIGKSCIHLLPVLVAVCGFFVAPGAIMTPIAVVCTLFELGRAALNFRAGKKASPA
ncbi:sodium:proton antiporter [Corynebacterium pyruviciproducens]|uniref:sodium:proton antiporter n=1 Tax=Corynebacterium pyruviciproducens TaxID=598660 RepID=UPI00288AC44A|nr:sodium:proton antiporter [Corynebacterium pyruviciproducens]